MKKECVFKCYAQGEWYYVYEFDYELLGVRYRVYRGRKWVCHVTFEMRQYAICTAINYATTGMNECVFDVVEKV